MALLMFSGPCTSSTFPPFQTSVVISLWPCMLEKSNQDRRAIPYGTSGPLCHSSAIRNYIAQDNLDPQLSHPDWTSGMSCASRCWPMGRLHWMGWRRACSCRRSPHRPPPPRQTPTMRRMWRRRGTGCGWRTCGPPRWWPPPAASSSATSSKSFSRCAATCRPWPGTVAGNLLGTDKNKHR